MLTPCSPQEVIAVDDNWRNGAEVRSADATMSYCIAGHQHGAAHVEVNSPGSVSLGALAGSILPGTGSILIGWLGKYEGRNPDWFVQMDQQLDSLSRLPVGWNSYGADPPNAVALASAKTALQILATAGIRPIKVSPSAQDGVIIYFVAGLRYADVECYNTGEIVATMREQGSEPEVWEVQPAELGDSLSNMVDFLAHG